MSSGEKGQACGLPGSGYPSDCEITQGLRERAMRRQAEELGEAGRRALLARAKEVRLLLLDVDGVLTDGTIIYAHAGTELKAFSTRDGFGIRLLQEAGVEVGIITARSSEAVHRRAQDLGLRHVFQGVRNKIEAFASILAEGGLLPAQIAYMGDDWLDLPLLIRVGLAATVADGAAEVKAAAHFVSSREGGRGAVRELCELIIEARGQQQELLARYRR
jgi:3-deoxy-D-manno-octulosonate 8-phosphate phosphatase (KDO 8-P phosphatase)